MARFAVTGNARQFCKESLAFRHGCFVAQRRGAQADNRLPVFTGVGKTRRKGFDILHHCHRSLSSRWTRQGGIGVPGMPIDTDRNKSTSVGRWLGGVERRRKLACTKLRGFGSRNAAASPFPSPRTPWQ